MFCTDCTAHAISFSSIGKRKLLKIQWFTVIGSLLIAPPSHDNSGRSVGSAHDGSWGAYIDYVEAERRTEVTTAQLLLLHTMQNSTIPRTRISMVS
jgi:hypothetical protein